MNKKNLTNITLMSIAMLLSPIALALLTESFWEGLILLLITIGLVVAREGLKLQ